MSLALRTAAPAALIVLLVAACGGGASPTSTPVSATATFAPVASTPIGTSDFTALCRDVANLTDLDYAFGKSFTVVQALDDAGKKLTLQHVQTFATSAPPELQQAATDLVGLWTDLVNNPQSVTESDPRWAEATNSINAWRTAHCPSAQL